MKPHTIACRIAMPLAGNIVTAADQTFDDRAIAALEAEVRLYAEEAQRLAQLVDKLGRKLPDSDSNFSAQASRPVKVRIRRRSPEAESHLVVNRV